MVGVGQRRTLRVAPAFGVKMETKNQIGMQLKVHARRTASNLAIAVEQNFALPANGLFFSRIIGIESIGTRLWHTVLNQNFPGQSPKIIRTLRRGRLLAISHKRNSCSERTQSRRQQSRNLQRQIAFLNWFAVADLKPALLHLRPASAEMTGVECNF